MARVDIVQVSTPEGNAVRGGDPVTVSVKVYPDRDWFKDKYKEELVIDFIYADSLATKRHLAVYQDDVVIDDATIITFKVKAEADAPAGVYYVQIKHKHFKEIVISGPEDGVITVS
ncbi:hypothetical protein ACFSQQ_33955 [Mesorhizobium kowhaii]|uniref:hypothetical protein n=1 Tax=Mesorhizobium kowhaii TaxID=1300272 RepID=UPI0035E994AF